MRMLACLLLLGCSPGTLPQSVGHHQVAILHHDADQIVCGAVVVGPHELLTAHHCLAGAAIPPDSDEVSLGGRVVRVVIRSGDLWPAPYWEAAEVLAERPELDLAALRTERRWQTWAATARRPTPLGAPVRVTHHGQGIGWQHDRGFLGPELEGAPFVRAAVQVRAGSSGGGLWDEHGQLIGIVTHADPEGRALAADYRAIGATLERRTTWKN